MLAPYPTSATVALPWGMDLVVDPAEALGAIVLRNAVYELAVSEIIYRLSDPGDVALDIGANIGYMTSIFAARVGLAGTVIACEPHPGLFKRLSSNVETWMKTSSALPAIRPMEVALSDHSGKAQLSVPPEFDVNMGTAGLVEDGGGNSIEVTAVQLDKLIPAGSSVGVAKIDVEGHEARVLAGGQQTLSNQRIRDLVFEEHRGYPSAATSLLESMGYRIFGIEQRLRRLVISDPSEARAPHDGSPPNFVASCQPDRLITRLAPAGWRTLRPRSAGVRRSGQARAAFSAG